MKHEFARKLRREQTDAERKLWQALRGRQFAGFKFRRQQPIGPYITDFVCFEVGLIVELDGDQHGSDEGIVQHRIRTQALEQDGFRVVRFPNHQVLADLGGRPGDDRTAFSQINPHPSGFAGHPLPQEEREKERASG